MKIYTKNGDKGQTQLLGGTKRRILRGKRKLTTFKKLPTQAPNTKTNIAAGRCSSSAALKSNSFKVGSEEISKYGNPFPIEFIIEDQQLQSF